MERQILSLQYFIPHYNTSGHACITIPVVMHVATLTILQYQWSCMYNTSGHACTLFNIMPSSCCHNGLISYTLLLVRHAPVELSIRNILSQG